jgi:hypothetical protein
MIIADAANDTKILMVFMVPWLPGLNVLPLPAAFTWKPRRSGRHKACAANTQKKDPQPAISRKNN